VHQEVVRAEAELKQLNNRDTEDLDIEGLADLATKNLQKLSQFYSDADSDIKRLIIGSVYPEKWVFDGESHRTTKINQAAELIYQINNKLRHKKTGVKFLEKFHSGEVPIEGLYSHQFIDDLKKIANLDTLFNSEPLSRDFKLRYKRCYTSQESKNRPLTQIWAENGFTKYKSD